MLVARNIEALMEQKGLDAAKLARLSGLNPTGIYDILKGKSRSPRIETIAKIANGLNVSVATIFSEQLEDGVEGDLMMVFSRLPKDKREMLLQAAQSWLPESAA